MKLAVVSPVSGLPALMASKLGYHMALGQHLLREPSYATWYKQRHMEGHFIIVDNGAHEGDCPPFGEVVEAALKIGADEIVLPDVLRNGPETVRLSYDQQDLVPICKRMVVPQGDSWDEWEDCLADLLAEVPFVSIGIAKHLERLDGGRPRALQIIHDRGILDHYNIHLLGTWADPLEELAPTLNTWLYSAVRGVDTSAPIAYAQQGREIEGQKPDLEWAAPVSVELAIRNIETLRQTANFVAGLYEASSEDKRRAGVSFVFTPPEHPSYFNR